MGMLGYRTQLDSSHLELIPPEVENYSLLEQVGYQVVILEIIFISIVINVLIPPIIICEFQFGKQHCQHSKSPHDSLLFISFPDLICENLHTGWGRSS